ncbi:uncharacterized protein LOC111331805 [Stylophora pistillata]|uniref:uncharacterized protein LOC111331805 n=1 Tax=Stylophora pistillata TaxID=50429 RepID=UPI000C0532DE|nr:uncharacterized protein LOC111331805 [Stylophora pistillata]
MNDPDKSYFWGILILSVLTLFSASLKATASLPPTETQMEACSNGSLTIQCGGFTNLNTIKKVNWKIKFSNSGWRDVSHCSMSHNECTRVPRLPQGIKIQSVSKQNVTIGRSENNSTINHVKVMCAVDQYTSTGTNTKLYIYDINFAIQCKYRKNDLFYECLPSCLAALKQE